MPGRGSGVIALRPGPALGLRPRGKKRVLALLVVAALPALSACGSSGPGTASRPTTVGPTSPGTRVTPGVGRLLPPGTRVGAAQRVAATGTTLVVRVKRVFDPLLGSGAKVPAGKVPVGVLIVVRNAGPGSYDSSYTSDFSLLTTGGPAMPVFAPAGVCQTYVQDFMNELSPGEVRTGCIAYLVPRGKALTKVRLAPDGGTAHHSASWVVP